MTTLGFVGFYEAVTWMEILKAKENVSVCTGGGVSASIDLGLYFIESLTNEEM